MFVPISILNCVDSHSALSILGLPYESNDAYVPVNNHTSRYKNYIYIYIYISAAINGQFDKFDQSDPNCVVVGDAQHVFTYSRLNSAFEILLQNRTAKLISMGYG